VQQTIEATLPEDFAEKPPKQQAKIMAAASRLPEASQRRMFRLLSEVDPAAVKKLLVWETLLKLREEAQDGQLKPYAVRANNRMQQRLRQQLREIDAQAVSGRSCTEEGMGSCVVGREGSGVSMRGNMGVVHIVAPAIGILV
jgi:hypothetical protein